ncbi:FGGY-family carbohydrate kinase [Micromonospora sp. NBC_01813]|uniref:FGGY-family carbohydrate kinase n=1 Tax=Micromonospora sp. NBC_01813 TaxID=2975988 RepID=UPI002DDA30B5|nr:FGGY-family carbohydrate kinase [Micromonospora sp. NBC_01813]WSA07260.1 FGGY-family carbohydrate kinase [Micromonospora sp. NBC_01813]
MGADPTGPYLLGVDIGTSSTKGVLTTPDGTVLRTATRPHGVSRPRPGWVEHDPDRVWWDEFVSVTRELLTGAPAGGVPANAVPAGAVAGVAVSGIGPCLLPTSDAGDPLRPAILYGVDTRASAEITELNQAYGAEALIARGGSPLTSQAIGPKLLWLRRHEPQVWQRTRRFMMASSLLVHRLTGEYVLDHHSASQCDPLYDLTSGSWATDLADEIAPGLRLPRLHWPTEVVGRITDAAAAQTGLAAGTPVTAGTVDAWAEAASVGATRPGDLMLMYGTTMFLVQTVDRPTRHPGLWATTGVLPGSHCLAAGMATSGAVIEWFRELTGGPDYAELTAQAAAVPAGSDGLLVLPYFAGERTPIFDDQARGVIAGLTIDHGRGHLYRALLEATAYGVRHNLTTMAEVADPARRVIAVGGGARSLWTQIVSDVTSCAQLIPEQTIGACYGDAYLAAVGVGLATTADDWTRRAGMVRPNPGATTRYDQYYQAYRELYPATRPITHRLAALATESATAR